MFKARSTSTSRGRLRWIKLHLSSDFGDKPLVVLTAGSGSDAEWKAAQDDLASLSTNSAHRVVDGAATASMILDEDAAAATTQAILDVISSVRSAGPLAR